MKKKTVAPTKRIALKKLSGKSLKAVRGGKAIIQNFRTYSVGK